MTPKRWAGALVFAVFGMAIGGMGWSMGARASMPLAMTVTGQPPSVATLAFWNASTGLAGGSQSGTGQIWETADAGRTWRPVWRGAPVTQVTATAGSTAYAVAGSTVVKTTDGGRTWTVLPSVDGGAGCGLSVPCMAAIATSGTAVYGVATLAPTIGTNPVAVAPYGSWLYVSNGSGTVSAYNLKTGHIGWAVPVGNDPGGLALSPDGRLLYVAEQNAARIAVVDIARRRVTATVGVVANPCAVVPDPALGRLLVTSASGGLTELSLTGALRVVRTVAAPGSCAAALPPGGKTVWLATTGQSVEAIDVADGTITRSVVVGQFPAGLAWVPARRVIAVTLPFADRVVLVSVATGRVLARFAVPGGPEAVAATAGGLEFAGQSEAVRTTLQGHVTASAPVGANVALGLGAALGADGTFYAVGPLEPWAWAPHAARPVSLAASGIPVDTELGLPVPVAPGRVYRLRHGLWTAVTPPGGAQSVCVLADGVVLAARGMDVLRSGDGGRTWVQTATLPVEPATDSTGLIPALSCAGNLAVDEMTGWGAAMSHDSYIAFASSDGGLRWTPTIEENYTHPGDPGINAPEGPGTYPGPVAITPGGTAIYAGWSPAANATAVGWRSGSALTYRLVPGVQGATAIAFPSRTVGYLASVQGRIVKTTDGGATWVPVFPPGVFPLAAVDFLSPTTGYGLEAAGLGDVLLATNDGGRIWRPVGPEPVDTYDVAFATPRRGYALAAGRTWVTEDGGRNWAPWSVAANAVAFVGRDGCAVGPRSAVVTTDAGAVWRVAPSSVSSTSALFCAAELADPSWVRAAGIMARGELVGVAGRAAWIADGSGLLRTEDAGLRWTALNASGSSAATTFVAYSFPTAVVGYALAQNGGLYRTADGGVRWTLVGPEAP